MVVACEARVFGSMMKRMTLMKLREALTISLVRDLSSIHTLCNNSSMVDMSMESGCTRAHTHAVVSHTHILKQNSFELSSFQLPR